MTSTTAADIGTESFTYTAARQVDTKTFTYSTSGLGASRSSIPTIRRGRSRRSPGRTVRRRWSLGPTRTTARARDGVSNTFGESSTYTYDHEGKVQTQTNANGTTTAYTYYEPRGWPASIAHSLSGTPFASYALVYDGGANTIGDITQVTELDGTTVSYGYDALYRFTSETRVGTNSFSHTYAYDLAGNVTDLDGSTFATYDAANKLATLSGGTFAYDTAGNLTAVSGAGLSSGTFTYETREKLSNQTSGATSLSYSYDVYGKRIIAKPSGTASTWTWYLFDGDRLVGEIGLSGSTPTPKVAYTWGADGIVSERLIGSNKSFYFHYGPQRETRQLTNSAGTVVDTYLYTGYGVPVTTTGTDYNPHRYGGQAGYYSEGPMGLTLATYRWYSPQLMRWMTRDPLRFRGGENYYGYVGDRPTRFTDRRGLQFPEPLFVEDEVIADPAAIGRPSAITDIPPDIDPNIPPEDIAIPPASEPATPPVDTLEPPPEASQTPIDPPDAGENQCSEEPAEGRTRDGRQSFRDLEDAYDQMRDIETQQALKRWIGKGEEIRDITKSRDRFRNSIRNKYITKK